MESSAHVTQYLYAKAVIAGALLCVRKYAVSFVHFLELFLSIGFLAHIRMILTRKFTECAFDLIIACIPSQTKDLVVISIAHMSQVKRRRSHVHDVCLSTFDSIIP